MSTSVVSTVNSVKLETKTSENKRYMCFANDRLQQELLETQQTYHNMLKSNIEEQKLNLEMLKNFTTQVSSFSNLYERSISRG